MRSGASRADARAARLARIRERAAKHAEEFAARQWLMVDDLAARWHMSKRAVRKIPRERLPYLNVGSGARELRRYSPEAVAAYEAEGSKGAA